MKIGIYDPYLDDLGGGEKYMMTIAECLSRDNTVDVFWDNDDDIELLKERFAINLSRIHIVSNIFSPQVSLFARLIVSRKYDILIILSDGSIPLVASKKLLLHVQQPLATSQTRTIWGKYKLSRVTKVFCNSVYTASYVKKTFTRGISVLYPPILLHPKKIEKENSILHVGRFRPTDLLTHVGDYKKQYVMVEAFKSMVDKGLKRWKLVMAVSVQGKDSVPFEELKNKAKDYPIEFLVNKRNEELWVEYSKAKIYWHASGYGEDLEKHPEFAEHFGISTVEAMGAGAVPVVVNAGGQKEIVAQGENGYLWNTLDELEEYTKNIINDEALWKKLSKNAIKTAEKFSGHRFCDEVQTLVQ